MKTKYVSRIARLLSWLFRPYYMPLVGFVALFTLTYLRLLPAGYSFNRDTLKDYCAEHTSGREYENLYCTALIMFDGWEIKDDYPW